MRLRKLVRQLKLGLAGLVGGFAFACGNPNPGEMPPLAPRPEPVQPVPSEPSKAPVPGAPDPMSPTRSPKQPTPDAGITSQSFHMEKASVTVPMQGPSDAGVPADAPNRSDALVLPPIPDAMPPDANKRPESVGFACC